MANRVPEFRFGSFCWPALQPAHASSQWLSRPFVYYTEGLVSTQRRQLFAHFDWFCVVFTKSIIRLFFSVISWLLWCLSCFMGPVVWNVTRFQTGSCPSSRRLWLGDKSLFEDSCNRHIWRSCHLRAFSVSTFLFFGDFPGSKKRSKLLRCQ